MVFHIKIGTRARTRTIEFIITRMPYNFYLEIFFVILLTKTCESLDFIFNNSSIFNSPTVIYERALFSNTFQILDLNEDIAAVVISRVTLATKASAKILTSTRLIIVRIVAANWTKFFFPIWT